MDMIKDGTGRGYLAKVNSANQLTVLSKSASIQHFASEDGNAYQIIGLATLSSGTVAILHVCNENPNRQMVITYIRHQVIGATGGTSFPNASNYFSIRLGRTYVSGGDTATAVNLYAGSGNTPILTSYQNEPTLTGTEREIDRWYTKADGDMNVFVKEGSVIIPPNETIEVAYVGDRTSGTVYARISFIMESV